MTVAIRPFEPGDLAEVVALLSRCLRADTITSEVFQRKVLLDQNFDARGAPVAVLNGEIAGFALGIVRKYALEDAAPDFDRSWITLIAVRPEVRRQGIGTRLVERIEDYSKSHGCKSIWVSPYAPDYFTPGVDVAAYPEALEFFKSNGYQEILRPLAMEADLAHVSAPAWLKDKESRVRGGVMVEPYRPELILPLLEWMRSEFPGDWQRYARESMTKIASGEFKADNVWIAHEDGRVVGYCRHDNTGRFGPLGVSESERGRGIGALLMFECLGAMRAKGLDRAWLMWTDDNVAKLYAKGGFHESRRFAVLKKAL